NFCLPKRNRFVRFEWPPGNCSTDIEAFESKPLPSCSASFGRTYLSSASQSSCSLERTGLVSDENISREKTPQPLGDAARFLSAFALDRYVPRCLHASFDLLHCGECKPAAD